jgi:hypothetical protein
VAVGIEVLELVDAVTTDGPRAASQRPMLVGTVVGGSGHSV